MFLWYKYTIELPLQQPLVFCPVHSYFNLSDVTATLFCQETLDIGQSSFRTHYFRGTQRQFSENICWEDDLRSRIFGTFVVKFLACLPLLGFSNI